MTDFPVVQKNNLWFAISMGLIGVIVGYGLAIGTNDLGAPKVPAQAGDQPAAGERAPSPSIEVKPVDEKNDHIRGSKNATISIIEYSEYQCSFCKRHHSTMQKIIEEYDGEVNWVFRHFPLGFHEHAQKSAEASECAADQGGNDAFWEYHDILFEKGLGPDKYVAHAEELGLDADKFSDCLDSGKHEKKVKDDMAGGSAAGVRGTPGNIIYNNKTKESKAVSGAQPFENFKTVLDEMLGK